MHWLELHIDTVHEGIEDVTAFLSSLGIDNVAIDDETDFREFLEDNRDYWDYVDESLETAMRGRSRVTFYLPEEESGFAKLAEVRIALQTFKEQRHDCGTLLMTLDSVGSEDWENNWKQYYKPLEVGERLLVVPKWEQAEAAGRVPVLLDPGVTFGTGSHATTRLCLQGVERYTRPGARVLDLGCGSGILSIAALKLGAREAAAVDIDPLCLRTARENADLNGIPEAQYHIYTGNILTDSALRETLGGGYDLVLANIVADVILGIAPAVPSLLAPGGVFLCSGVIGPRAAEVRDGLTAHGFTIREENCDEDWYAFACVPRT